MANFSISAIVDFVTANKIDEQVDGRAYGLTDRHPMTMRELISSDEVKKRKLEEGKKNGGAPCSSFLSDFPGNSL